MTSRMASPRCFATGPPCALRAPSMSSRFDELRGLAKGSLCDGAVVVSEAHALRQWLVSNCEVIDEPSCQALAMLLIEMLRDARLDATESAELKSVLRELMAALPRSSPA